jgi:hypothetical protein
MADDFQALLTGGPLGEDPDAGWPVPYADALRAAMTVERLHG